MFRWKERCPRDPLQGPRVITTHLPPGLSAPLAPTLPPRPSPILCPLWLQGGPSGQEEAIRGSLNPKTWLNQTCLVSPRQEVPSRFLSGASGLSLHGPSANGEGPGSGAEATGRVSLSRMWREDLPVPTCQPQVPSVRPKTWGKVAAWDCVGAVAMRKP